MHTKFIDLYFYLTKLGSALGGPGKLFILRGHEVQIQIPGGHTLTGRLEHGDRPSWIRNPQEPAISNNVFVDMPPPYGKSFVANVVDRAPNSPEDPNFKHFEAFIIGSGKKSYKAQLHPQSGRNPVHPTIFVRHPGTKTNYEGQLLPA